MDRTLWLHLIFITTISNFELVNLWNSIETFLYKIYYFSPIRTPIIAKLYSNNVYIICEKFVINQVSRQRQHMCVFQLQFEKWMYYYQIEK